MCPKFSKNRCSVGHVGIDILTELIPGDDSIGVPSTGKEDVVQVKKEAEKISENAIDTITPKGHPKTYKAWGKTWVDKINVSANNAALRVAKSKSCDKVNNVFLSTRSVPKKSAIYTVQCTNNEQFYIPFEEVNSNDVPLSVKEKVTSVSDGEYISICADKARLQVAFPSTFDYHVIGSLVHHADNGNLVIKLPIEFKNAFGVPIEKIAMCTFDDRGFTSFSIVR